MIVLSGADLVLPDRILSPGTLVIDGGRIVEVRAGSAAADRSRDPSVLSLPRRCVVPGFVDVHVHGVEGIDTLDGSAGNPVASMAAKLPRYGVTAFCPTTVACSPDALARVLAFVAAARRSPASGAARVLPAHLESNFISDEYRGAQPRGCLRVPRGALAQPSTSGAAVATAVRSAAAEFEASDLLSEIERAGAEVGIVTLAPELDGGLDLIRWVSSRGHRASLGHSGATFEMGLAAAEAGACHATHLFNRMPPLLHRAPGLAGAVLEREDVAAELICDGFHVHPAFVRMAVAVKGASRVMAITDGTALSGLQAGARAMLGGQAIVAGEGAALLADGTIAGSVLTMDRAFRMLVRTMGFSMTTAAALCSTTAARELGLGDRGVLAAGATADLVVLDEHLAVVRTYVGGELAYARDALE
jgi:N-acetylglucosamine-6-phosphate deacetylase